MSDIIQNYSLNAQLAQAAYADLRGITNEDIQAYIDALTVKKREQIYF